MGPFPLKIMGCPLILCFDLLPLQYTDLTHQIWRFLLYIFLGLHSTQKLQYTFQENKYSLHSCTLYCTVEIVKDEIHIFSKWFLRRKRRLWARESFVWFGLWSVTCTEEGGGDLEKMLVVWQQGFCEARCWSKIRCL